MRGEERFTAIRNFNTTDDTFIFLLSSRAGGQGLNLTAADTVIFYDHDFNPQVSFILELFVSSWPYYRFEHRWLWITVTDRSTF